MSTEMQYDHQARRFFLTNPDICLVVGSGGAISCSNLAAERVFGAACEQGTSLTDLLLPEARAALSSVCEGLREGGEPSVFECSLRGRDGRYETYVCVAWRTAGDEIHVTLRPNGNAVDRVPDLAALEKRARILDVIFNSLPIAVWTCNENGILTLQEGKALETAGLRSGQLVGRNLFDLYANDPTIVDTRAALEGRAAHNSSEVHGVFWENWVLPMREESGTISGLVGVSMDVSEFRRVEQELLAKIELIHKQQQVIRELGVPIIQVWDQVLTLPLVGVVDSARADEVMANLLQTVLQTRARFAILDLTGVDIVDTATANHLLQMISAIRLMGAEGIITGIRPTVAQTMIGLGLDISSTVTLASLRDALKFCIRRMNEAA
ncbi:STAS domain-containing protein [Polyangium mundeleinium]|uniref:PAS domain S-box protein n=1 Tax=Polyangium mundeleinium TaxID=2995306 RepID=A0ABT5F1G2_9BACT|nr:STAS domain-containing protein [Polyangium mundeleinium]MDC0747921.1 PAS domain S-box protein [Polyangium mundeleinium]